MIRPGDVTIIVPHLGKTDEQEYAIEQCLLSLHETVPDIKIIIAKNGLECKHTHIIPNSTVIRVNEQGQCRAVNAAIATTNTPWVFITNDDMIYAPGWFEKLTEHLESLIVYGDAEPFEIECVSPQLVEPRSGAPTFLVEFCGGAGGDFNKQKWLDFASKHKDGNVRSGFNLPLLIKRELWDLVGGYDINYDPWGSNSDSDLEYKIKLAGVQPYQNTNCLVYHFSQTSGTFEPQNGGFYGRNFAYFKEKWGFDRTDTGIWEASFEIPGIPERIYKPEWEGKYK